LPRLGRGLRWLARRGACLALSGFGKAGLAHLKQSCRAGFYFDSLRSLSIRSRTPSLQKLPSWCNRSVVMIPFLRHPPSSGFPFGFVVRLRSLLRSGQARLPPSHACSSRQASASQARKFFSSFNKSFWLAAGKSLLIFLYSSRWVRQAHKVRSGKHEVVEAGRLRLPKDIPFASVIIPSPIICSSKKSRRRFLPKAKNRVFIGICY